MIKKLFKEKAKDTIYPKKHIGILRKAEDVSVKVLKRVSEQDLKAAAFISKTKELKKLIKDGASLDDVMVEAFATAHNAIKEVYGISLYKVQIIGGYALHKGDAAEMRTGEGKTLTAILPAYLNSLTGKGVHIITVNEYLATRDAFNTGKVFKLLGLTTGVVSSEEEPAEKKENYNKDITYATNSEIGFDYLRDNIVLEPNQKLQRKFNYAIVDEVDSILIDEARTPLIISGGSKVTKDEYIEPDKFVKSLSEEDYIIDRETKRAFLSETGVSKTKNFFGLSSLYKNENAVLIHRISNALQANLLFHYDVDYTVKDDEIVLIDIFTGRFLIGRQFSEGLNQAIEAKEEVKINPETKTVASITYQNLFRMYKKLSGMSGTAIPEEEEFMQVYNMRVIPIPTNVPIIRKDLPDFIFATKNAKIKAVVKLIKKLHETGQPILVGTRSVQDSEELAKILIDDGLSIEVLNAKNHSREAEIISKAGILNAITISTNMAGRGTDIKLGKGVIEKGGLFVIGTERHESRRIDDQLRGRSGRQGDIGFTRFFISLEDELIKRAGMTNLSKFQKSLDTAPLESKMVAKSLNMAQKRIEGSNYDYRKSIIEYDDVLNSQRSATYKQRDLFLSTKNPKDILYQLIDKWVNDMANREISFNDGIFRTPLLNKFINEEVGTKILSEEHIQMSIKESKDTAIFKLTELIDSKFKNLEDEHGFKTNKFLKDSLIRVLDSEWTEQIEKLTKLKTGIRYRQYAQKNPVQIYVFESKDLFERFKINFRDSFLRFVFNFEIKPQQSSLLEGDTTSRETKNLIVL